LVFDNQAPKGLQHTSRPKNNQSSIIQSALPGTLGRPEPQPETQKSNVGIESPKRSYFIAEEWQNTTVKSDLLPQREQLKSLPMTGVYFPGNTPNTGDESMIVVAVPYAAPFLEKEPQELSRSRSRPLDKVPEVISLLTDSEDEQAPELQN
jgi:hypothetical protein